MLLIDWANFGFVWGSGKWESASHLQGELQVCIKRLTPYDVERGCELKLSSHSSVLSCTEPWGGHGRAANFRPARSLPQSKILVQKSKG